MSTAAIALPTAHVRLIAGVHGSASKLEIKVGAIWHDISHLCSRAQVDVSRTDVTTISFDLAYAEAAVEGVVDEATLRVLERFVKQQREES